MEKVAQKNLLLEIAEKNGEIIYRDNKMLAKLSWLRSWTKNPRTAEKKDLTRLENQIEELGVYKPLVVYLEGDHGTILGGNMRHSVLTRLAEKSPEKYEYVWVSVVNADSDVDKLKYALSDNFSAGTYSRDKLKEIINAEQGNLFSDYQLEFAEKQEITDFISSMGKTDEEMKMDSLEKTLKGAGIDEDIISDIREMSNFGCQKVGSNFDPQRMIGTGAIEYKDRKIFVMKLAFGEEQEELYKLMMEKFNGASSLFKETNGELYERVIGFYGKGQGDVLVKTLHLLAGLPKEPAFQVWKETFEQAEEVKVKKTEAIEEFFSGGRETLID